MATASAPMLPLAPGRLSTTTDCPSSRDNASAKLRARMSVLPAAAKGTMILMGLLG
ncbi:hypothetical protein D3C71_1955930 [compost metagenome]